MIWLEAALAFALTMTLLATIVTMLMEVGYRLFLTREKGFNLMICVLFEQVLWPRVRQRLTDTSIDAARQAFVEALTCNPVAQVHSRRMWRRLDPHHVQSMSIMQFAERLAGTDVGRAIAAEGNARITAMINDLAQKFDRYGAAASQRFVDRSRVWTVAISFVLAFALNVDGIRLFQTFLHDDDTRKAVVGLQEKIENAYKGAQEKQAALLSVDAGKQPQAESLQAAREQIEDMHSVAVQAQKQVLDLTTLGVPIGFDYFPICRQAQGKSPASAAAANAANRNYLDPKCRTTASSFGLLEDTTFWGWLGSVIITGFLIGLGSPFWFDLVRGLSQSIRLLKSADDDSKIAPQTAAASVSERVPTAPPQNPVEAFTTAMAAAPPIISTRRLLTPSGEIG